MEIIFLKKKKGIFLKKKGNFEEENCIFIFCIKNIVFIGIK